MVVVEGYGEAGRKMKAAEHSLPFGKGVVGTAAVTGEPVLASDTLRDPHWVPHPDLPDTKGELAVPIKLRDEVLGILDVQSDTAGALTEEDEVMLLGLAGQIASAMESTRLLEQVEATLSDTEAQAGRLIVLHQVSEELSQAETLDDIFRVAAANTPQLVRADTVSVSLLDDVGDCFRVIALRGAEKAIPEDMQLPVDGTAIGIALQENRVMVTSPQPDSKLLDVRSQAKQGLLSAIHVPLVVGGRPVGTLNVGSIEPNVYTARDENLLLQLASLLASMMENRRLFEQAQSRAEQERALREITARVRGFTDPDAIIRTAVRELGVALGRPTFVRLGSAEGLSQASMSVTDDDDGQRAALREGGE
jgi:sigma-B regulation protein RsbU (phosphoserine phosphatase)